MRLYEITDEILAALGDVEAAGGEVTDEVGERLDALDIALEEKVERIGPYIRDLDLEAEKVKAEETRLYDRRKALQNRAKGLKNYLMRCLVAVGRDRIKTLLVTFAIQKNSRPSIVWTQGEIPEKYRRVTVELDGTKVYEDFKAGELPEGFEVVYGDHAVLR